MKSLFVLPILAIIGLAAIFSFQATTQNQDIRYVVIHFAGPAWDESKSMFAQDYIMVNPNDQASKNTHVEHYKTLMQAKQLDLGGPFMVEFAKVGEKVGMMIPEKTMSQEQIAGFASQDPAVLAGILDFEIVPWWIAMQSKAQ